MVSFQKLCSNCKHQNCCTDSYEPLVFSSDLIHLKQIKKDNNDFLKKIKVNNKEAIVIKKKRYSNQCIFWDEEKKNCSIYEIRPFDCKAYPFDILQINGKYHWIVYTCNPQSNWKWTEDYLSMLENDKSFAELRQNIKTFAGNTKRILPTESQKTPYVILREVNLQKQ